jgi:hypothetical protein
LSEILDAFWVIANPKTIYLNIEASYFWRALAPASDDTAVKYLPFSALTSITVHDKHLDVQLTLDTLRVRSELGGTQLQYLQFSYPPPAPIMLQLGELVSQIRIMEYDANGIPEDDSSSEDEF